VRKTVLRIIITILLIAMFTLTVNINSVRAETLELAYDDGTAESWGVGSCSPEYIHLLAVCFESPWRTNQLLEAKFYIAEHASYSFKLHVMDNLKNDICILEVVPLNTGWFVVDLTTYSIRVNKNFYVGMELFNTFTENSGFLYVPMLGYDDDMPGNKSFWVIKPPGEERSWKELDWSTFSGHDMMIRAVVSPLIPVGGYSFKIGQNTEAEPLITYIALIATITAVFTTAKRKTERRR
jgi:hypothetical protein